MDKGSEVGKVMVYLGNRSVVKSSKSQLGERHMWRWEHTSLWGGRAIAVGGAVSNESVLLLNV